MKLKTYRSATLRGCLEKIKSDLGPDAFVLGQREVRPSRLMGLLKKAHVEVTAAVDHAAHRPAEAKTGSSLSSGTLTLEKTPAPRVEDKPSAPNRNDRNDRIDRGVDTVHDEVRLSLAVPREPSPVNAADSNQALLEEIQKLKAMVQAITARPAQSVWLKPMAFPSDASRELCSSLLAQGLDENLAYSLAGTEDQSPEAVALNLASQIPVSPDFIRSKGAGGPGVVALIGPTGVGKTTTIAKIAAIAAFQKNLRVGLVTLDTFRIAAIDQLKTYSEIIGVPLRVVKDPQELPVVIRSFSGCDLVLIDTTGRNPRELSDDGPLAKIFADSKDIQKALVVSATTRPQDLTEIIDRYKVFNPDCLIFTKLDETDARGSVVNETLRSGLPLAYVTIGQTVPWDIVKPDSKQLADLLLKPDRSECWKRLVASAHAAHQVVESRRGTQKQTKRQTYS